MNTNILIDRKPIVWDKWLRIGLIHVDDLFYYDGSLKSHEELGVAWFKLGQMHAAIPRIWLSYLCDKPDHSNDVEDLYTTLFKCDKTRNKKVYEMLLDDGNKALIKYAHRWIKAELPNLEFDVFFLEFKQLYKYTKRTKYHDFQYRLLLHKIIVNQDPAEWKIKESGYCTFCFKEIETLSHLFCKCEIVKPVVKYFLEDVCNISRPVETQDILFSNIHTVDSHVYNFVCTFLKQFIYKCRCKSIQPTTNKFVIELKYYHNIELAIAKQENKLFKHVKYWSPIFTYDNKYTQTHPI